MLAYDLYQIIGNEAPYVTQGTYEVVGGQLAHLTKLQYWTSLSFHKTKHIKTTDLHFITAHICTNIQYPPAARTATHAS